MLKFPLVTMTPRERNMGLCYLLLHLLVINRLLPFALNLLFPQMDAGVQNFLCFLIGFLCIGMLLRSFLVRSAKQLMLAPGRCTAVAAVGLVLYFAGNFALAAALQTWVPGFANINDSTVTDLLLQHPVLMAITTVLFAPVVEECLYRGVVFGALFEKSPVLAYVLSAMLFSAIHVAAYWGVQPGWVLALCFVQYLPAGLCLSAAYHFSGSLFVPIAIHAAVNAVGIFAVR